MPVKTKVWLNRGGLIVAAIGIGMVIVAGGDTDSALRIAGVVVAVGGEVMRLIREIMG